MTFWVAAGFHTLEFGVLFSVLSFTSSNSLIRPAALPLLVALGIYALPLNLHGMPTKLVAGMFSMNSVGTICQYLDSVLISRWSYSAQGPTSSLGGQRNIQLESTPARSKHGSNGTSKGSQGSQAPDTSPWARLRWGWFASTSWRAPATKWEVKNVPPFDFNNPEWVPTRTRFLLGKLKTLVLSLLFIDALGIPPQDPAQGAMVFAPDKVAFFRRLGNVSAQDVIIRFVVSAIGWTSIFCVLNACYSLLAIISVTTGLAPVDQWPPLFGKLADCYSIRQFWGRFWHQTLRQRISSPSHFLTYSVFGLRKGSLVARYMNIWLTFVVSGLMHVAEEFGTGVALQQSGSMHFFCTQACGIMFEDAFQAIFHYAAGKRQRRGTKALGYVWFIGWMAWSSPAWLYPKLRNNEGGVRDKSLPFTVLGQFFQVSTP